MDPVESMNLASDSQIPNLNNINIEHENTKHDEINNSKTAHNGSAINSMLDGSYDESIVEEGGESDLSYSEEIVSTEASRRNDIVNMFRTTYNRSEVPANNVQYDAFMQRVLEQQIIEQKVARSRKYAQIVLEEKYPVNYIIVHSILITILSLLSIILQIIMIVEKSPNYYVGSGIWVAVYFLASITLLLIIIKKRNYNLFVVAFMMNTVGIVIALFGLIVVFATGYASSLNLSTGGDSYCIVMMVIGILYTILPIIFNVMMICVVNGKCCKQNDLHKIGTEPPEQTQVESSNYFF